MRTWTNEGSTAKYDYNYEGFKNIDCEYKAYWLGFLYADGYVSKNHDKFSLAIANKDKGHLQKFRDFIVPDRPLEEQEKQGSCRVTVSSKLITGDLIQKGCVPQKSLILCAPPQGILPRNLERHFIRGYFDGDGCARYIKKGTRISISFTGTEEFLKFVLHCFNKEEIKFRSKIRKATCYNAYVWECEAIPALKKIYEYLYGECTLCLDRKRDIFEFVNAQ